MTHPILRKKQRNFSEKLCIELFPRNVMLRKANLIDLTE